MTLKYEISHQHAKINDFYKFEQIKDNLLVILKLNIQYVYLYKLSF